MLAEPPEYDEYVFARGPLRSCYISFELKERYDAIGHHLPISRPDKIIAVYGDFAATYELTEACETPQGDPCMIYAHTQNTSRDGVVGG